MVDAVVNILKLTLPKDAFWEYYSFVIIFDNYYAKFEFFFQTGQILSSFLYSKNNELFSLKG